MSKASGNSKVAEVQRKGPTEKKTTEWKDMGETVVFEGVGLPELSPVAQTFYTWYAKSKKSSVDQVMKKVCEDFASGTLEQLTGSEVSDLVYSLLRQNEELQDQLMKATNRRKQLEAQLKKMFDFSKSSPTARVTKTSRKG